MGWSVMTGCSWGAVRTGGPGIARGPAETDALELRGVEVDLALGQPAAGAAGPLKRSVSNRPRLGRGSVRASQRPAIGARPTPYPLASFSTSRLERLLTRDINALTFRSET